VVRGVVALGRHPYGIAAGPDDRTVYVTNEGSGDVSVVDLVNRRVTATILVDAISGLPREIAVQPRPVASASAGHGQS
jgi:YVTN family beta-propeller protein